MTGSGGTGAVSVQLHWRASPLAVSIATAAAVALTAAVLGSCWALIAFAAPLLGVLCALSWQPPAPTIRVRAEPGSQRCFESEPARLDVAATAAGAPATAIELRVTADPGLRLEPIAAGGSGGDAQRALSLTATRWGRYPLTVTVAVVARGGLLRGTATAAVAELTVFPLIAPQPTPIPDTDLLDRMGNHRTRRTGRGVEYADIRAYLPGDPLRWVNWPVSARRGSLYVTQRLTDRAAEVVVVLDAYPQPRGPATVATERTVYGAAQVVQSALRTGDRAGIVALGGGRARWLPPDIGRRQFYRVLDAVLDAPAAATATAGTLAPRAAVPPGAIVVAFSTLLDAAFALALTDLRTRGHVVLAVDVLPDSPFDDEPDPLVAQLWRLQRSAMYRDMAATGIDVAPWPVGQPLAQALRSITDRHRRRGPTRR